MQTQTSGYLFNDSLEEISQECTSRGLQKAKIGDDTRAPLTWLGYPAGNKGAETLTLLISTTRVSTRPCLSRLF